MDIVRTTLAIVIACVGSSFWPAAPERVAPVGTEVYDWNTISFDVTTVTHQNAIIASHATSMMHIAIHDALNSIDRRYAPYIYEPRSEAGALPEAAIARPRAWCSWMSSRRSRSSTRRRGPRPSRSSRRLTRRRSRAWRRESGKAQGIAAGEAAAKAVLNLRKDDKRSAVIDYKPGNEPGKWRPHPNPQPANPPIDNPEKAAGNAPAVLPHWATVTPFTMAAPWQFRMDPPPALNTEVYARDFEEVKKIGSKTSETRTPEQTEIAKAWYDGSPHHWSRIARIVGTERKLDRWDSARLMALVNMAVADGYIAGADTRYLYGYWRPVTAIRAADTDGNDATQPDPAWESFLNTPALPDYPSTHSVCSGAATAVLAGFFGSDAVAFSVPSGPPFPGITRSFKSFTDSAKEICDSRIYDGSPLPDGVHRGNEDRPEDRPEGVRDLPAAGFGPPERVTA